MHFTVETLKIWSLVIACHHMSSVIQRAVGAWSRIARDLSTGPRLDLDDQCKQGNKRYRLGEVFDLAHWRGEGHGKLIETGEVSTGDTNPAAPRMGAKVARGRKHGKGAVDDGGAVVVLVMVWSPAK
ncbi:hypothetical protein Acr_24g0006400 [Actinidia rufa]|uniref:Uncharacterized protein n=1 Tax=Actinidia rufa TaxID=165716 RepID=A0A7J0GUD3_9ERIC|nr:hypothetical protein Acr_24g0006400 [Actinidia rufa]